jgi:hypothetical protein
MSNPKAIMVIGLEPTLLDFSDPALANRGLDADKIRSALERDKASLNALGHHAELCLTDTGETAEAVVRARLSEKPFDCVVIGAGIRTVPRYFLLFEKLINVVHERAPRARICFNTKPDDTAEAVRRWL